MIHAESIEQRAYVAWARMSKAARYVFAVPNGGKRNVREAARLKSEGVLAGVPDILLPVPAGTCSGLFIEFKSWPNKLTTSQSVVISELVERGYCCVVAYSAESAIKVTTDYLAGKLTPTLMVVGMATPARSHQPAPAGQTSAR